MEETKSKYAVIIARCSIAVLALVGILTTVNSSDGSFMSNITIYYYTIQSNIWVLLLMAAAVILSLFRVREPNWFRLLRFVIAIAIMVTFLVFWTMLAPVMPVQYYFTVSNLTLHTLVPLMALFDTVFFDSKYIPSKKQIMFCAIPPILYFIFVMVRAQLSTVKFGDSMYPYWFLDIDKYGWFSLKDGIGVFYWVIVVIGIVIGLGSLIRLLKKTINKRTALKDNAVANN